MILRSVMAKPVPETKRPPRYHSKWPIKIKKMRLGMDMEGFLW
jgi:hypothetical protein